MAQRKYDLAIAGGGLAGGLIALALKKLRPELAVAVIEGADHFGGNHVWSFFDTDILDEQRWLLEPLISHSWDGYDMRFPKYERSLGTRYNSILSEQFHDVLHQRLDASDLFLSSRISSLDAGQINIENGDSISATAIIDARGGGDFSALEKGWQKFAGQILELEQPHGLKKPIIMDATVEQIDGYRFVYSLPFTATQVFVEDTYYSKSRDMDVGAYQARIAEYANDQGWKIASISRNEAGCLPVLYGGDFDAFWNDGAPVQARVGSRAALVHPITSYSLPMAVRTAIRIAALPDMTQGTLDKCIKEYAASHWQETKFYRLLCAMMFRAAKPEQRYLTLQHTYSKDEALIERFYAGTTTLMDQAALLTGRPPVPITKALHIMLQYR